MDSKKIKKLNYIVLLVTLHNLNMNMILNRNTQKSAI